MFAHAAGGYGGHGTLCGALGVGSCIINLVTYDDNKSHSTLTDALLYWYARSYFPSEMFDDICKIPKQIKTKAMTPICHTSVSKWTLAAGTNVSGKEKKERCAKVTGEVIYIIVKYLNKYFAGTWTPSKWEHSKEISHCLGCHGPDDAWHTLDGNNNQQGHMECLYCHTDHTDLDACEDCHKDAGEKMATTQTKHKTLACSSCHRGRHPNIPRCETCHDEPHSVAVHEKIPLCLDCHVDPHFLANPSKGKKL